MKILRGHLLIASPALLDPNFCKSVVLLIQHNADGSFGLVLNRPTDKAIHEVWAQLSETPCDSDQPIHWGGPVPGPLMAIHTHESLSDSEILPGVYFSVQKENLDQIVAQEDHSFKLFVGHAGWAPGQLEAELKEDSWRTTPATFEHVFQGGSELWDKTIKAVADAVLGALLKPKHLPKDPSLN